MTDTALHWFVAKVRTCQEKVTVERLRKMGIQSWIPLQRQRRKWSDRIKIIEAVMITQHVFVRCTEAEVNGIYKNIPGIVAFLKKPSDKAEKAIISDAEMENFRKFVGSVGDDVKYEPETWHPGDKVMIVSGPMAGVEGVLYKVGENRMLSVRLGMLGSASSHISADNVIVMKEE